uniref:Uncharacterized protein n=1 Tax=Oryza glumipatula TaxID=40148 RepID=A0A0D9Y345_9ORYZ
MAFVSAAAAAAAATTAAAFLPGVSSVARAGTPLLSLQRQPLAGSLRAAAQGSSASSGQVVMESKVKAKKKKGSGAGNLPGAIDAEIREAQDYLAIDEQEPVPENFPFEILDEEGMSVVILKRDYKDEKIEEITIDDMLIVENAAAEGDEKFPYEGPEFTELPVNVQKGLFKYLEQRGITLPTTNYMHDYMVTKQTKEYVGWMTKLKDFVRQ